MTLSPLSPEAVAQMVADLATKSAMINMGEKIAWGSDSGVMDAAADMLTTLAAENATLRASEAAALERVKVLEEALADPIAVHANMLRGAIAMPTVDQIIHLYGIGVLCEALAPMIVREASDPTDYERKVAQMKKDFPNGI